MKKIISLLICAVMIAGTLTVAASALSETNHLPFVDDETYSAGDVNDDGNVNAMDAYAVKASVCCLNTYVNADAADLNADGCANARDVLIFKAVLAEAADISDYVSDSPIYKMTIAGNPISDYDIVVPEGTNADEDNVYVAALILRTYIYSATDFCPSIEYASEKPHAIRLHAIAPASEESDEMGLGLEDYIYEVVDGDLNIYGTLRGNMYAAYEICEKFLGFRFYDNRYTYSYRMRTSDIPEGLREYHRVPMEFRFTGTPISTQDTVFQSYFANRQNGTQIYAFGSGKYGYLTGPRFINAHSFGVYRRMMAGTLPEDDGRPINNLLDAKYADGGNKIDERKVFYEWQPCASDNTAYYEMYNGMLETMCMMMAWGGNDWYEEIRDLGIYFMSFSINDNGFYCTCTTCTAKVNGSTMSVRRTTLEQLEYYTGDYTLSEDGKKVTFKTEGYSGIYMDLAVRAAKEVTTEYHGYDYDFNDTFPPLDERIQTVYPGMKLYLIIYDHTIPESVKPAENIVLMYCGHGCNNHILGTGDCGDGTTVLGGSNKINEISMPAWSKYCHDAGGKIYYWSYGVNYMYYLAPCPNVLDFYYNMKYIYDVCHFDGIYYESCGGPHNNFEDMKAYIAARMMWEPDTDYEGFTAMVKEYMKMYYGRGYEDVYEYMLLQNAAGDATGWCFINNHDRPGDMYSYDYLREHYEEMRALLTEALKKDDSSRVNDLMMGCDFLGLSACYNEMYTNGTAASRALYEQRFTDMYNYIKNNGIRIYLGDYYTLPSSISFDSDPATQFYKVTSRG